MKRHQHENTLTRQIGVPVAFFFTLPSHETPAATCLPGPMIVYAFAIAAAGAAEALHTREAVNDGSGWPSWEVPQIRSIAKSRGRSIFLP